MTQHCSQTATNSGPNRQGVADPTSPDEYFGFAEAGDALPFGEALIPVDPAATQSGAPIPADRLATIAAHRANLT